MCLFVIIISIKKYIIIYKMRTMQRKGNQHIHETFGIDKKSDEHFFHLIDYYEKVVSKLRSVSNEKKLRKGEGFINSFDLS